MKSSMRASLKSIDGSKKRECYVATPAPKFIRKHKDLWRGAWAADQELPSYSDDVLYFTLQEVCTFPGMFTHSEPEKLAIYQEIPRDMAQVMMAAEAQAAAQAAQLTALQKAAAEKATKEMLAQAHDFWQIKKKPVLGPPTNVTTAATQIGDWPWPPNAADAPKPVEKPKPDPLEIQVPDPLVPKRRMMK